MIKSFLNSYLLRLIEILSHVTFEQCLVFSNYQTGAEEISVCLTKEGFSNQVNCLIIDVFLIFAFKLRIIIFCCV